MKPFARMTSQAVALRRLILVSILVLAAVAFIGVLQMKWVAYRGARAEAKWNYANDRTQGAQRNENADDVCSACGGDALKIFHSSSLLTF